MGGWEGPAAGGAGAFLIAGDSRRYGSRCGRRPFAGGARQVGTHQIFSI
jgi:hypothetical protein